MTPFVRLFPALVTVALAACAGPRVSRSPAVVPEFLVGPILETAHRGSDDLLSAGLGLAGLRGAPSAYADPLHPSAAELRRRAIQSSWKGIADPARWAVTAARMARCRTCRAGSTRRSRASRVRMRRTGCCCRPPTISIARRAAWW